MIRGVPSRRRKLVNLVLLIVFALPIAAQASRYTFDPQPHTWWNSDRSSAGLLPPASQDPAARVLVFAGRDGSWRGIFAVHTWIVIKPQGGDYTRYDVSGFGNPVRRNVMPPDARYFGYVPRIVADISGPQAAAAIPRIEAAIQAYAYSKLGDYRLWPGPNSNTFVATVLRAAPELGIAMPPTAIGKDFRADGSLAGWTVSRTGIEASLWGLLGVKLGWVEGIELNLFTLVAGLDVRHPALKLPALGRIGFSEPTAAARL